MKRLISLVLICLLLFGCTPRQQDTGIRFCYPRKDYIYSVTGGSVAWETRDVRAPAWPEPALSSPAPPPSSSKAETAAWPWTGTA